MTRVVPEPVGPGQESVWRYPRPPLLEAVAEQVEIIFAGRVVLDTTRPLRVLETSHPPTYYLPAADFRPGTLRPATGRSLCEWKGEAVYYDVVVGDAVAARAGWGYPRPDPPYAALLDHVAVYPAAMDRCTVDGEVVQPQPGGFYGGWVTSRVVGPFKGAPGTSFW